MHCNIWALDGDDVRLSAEIPLIFGNGAHIFLILLLWENEKTAEWSMHTRYKKCVENYSRRTWILGDFFLSLKWNFGFCKRQGNFWPFGPLFSCTNSGPWSFVCKIEMLIKFAFRKLFMFVWCVGLEICLIKIFVL